MKLPNMTENIIGLSIREIPFTFYIIITKK